MAESIDDRKVTNRILDRHGRNNSPEAAENWLKLLQNNGSAKTDPKTGEVTIRVAKEAQEEE